MIVQQTRRPSYENTSEYIASLEAMKHNVWMNGQGGTPGAPSDCSGVNIVSLTYEWPKSQNTGNGHATRT